MGAWDAVMVTQIFGTVLIGIALVIMISYRKKIGRFAALIFPLTVTFFAFVSYSILAGPKHHWVSTFFTFFMIASLFVTVFYLLKSIERERRLF